MKTNKIQKYSSAAIIYNTIIGAAGTIPAYRDRNIMSKLGVFPLKYPYTKESIHNAIDNKGMKPDKKVLFHNLPVALNITACGIHVSKNKIIMKMTNKINVI